MHWLSEHWYDLISDSQPARPVFMLVSPKKRQLRYENVPNSTVHHTIHSMQLQIKFKVDRLQIIVVAKKYIFVLQIEL